MPEILLLQGDSRTLPLADGCVSCCVCSPPYWSLRDYDTGHWEGGNPACAHRSPTMRAGRNEQRPMLGDSAATNAAQLRLAASAPPPWPPGTWAAAASPSNWAGRICAWRAPA